MSPSPDPLKFLNNRPAVHQLCAGAFLQGPFRVGFDVMATPLQALGFGPQARHLARFVTEVLGAPLDEPSFQTLRASGESAFPVLALSAPLTIDAPPEELEGLAVVRLDLARQAIAWASGDQLTPFGMVVASTTETHFRLLPPHSRRRQRLFGLGGTADDFQESLSRIQSAAQADEHFAFALSLHHDAVREYNPRFRIARLFNVLECLAYRLKSSERPSRKAVKHLIGLPDGPDTQLHANGRAYNFDLIEIAGRVRDKLFHGVPFQATDLNTQSRPAYDLYQDHPEMIADSLAGRCEWEIGLWAHGQSRGLSADS